MWRTSGCPRASRGSHEEEGEEGDASEGEQEVLEMEQVALRLGRRVHAVLYVITVESVARIFDESHVM